MGCKFRLVRESFPEEETLELRSDWQGEEATVWQGGGKSWRP